MRTIRCSGHLSPAMHASHYTCPAFTMDAPFAMHTPFTTHAPFTTHIPPFIMHAPFTMHAPPCTEGMIHAYNYCSGR